MAFLYLPEDADFLVERWLSSRVSRDHVCLLHEQASQGAVATLQSRFPCIAQAMAIDAPGAAERLRPLFNDIESPAITLPISLDVLPLRYRPQVLLPDVRAYWPLVRTLWMLGFREIVFFGLSGAQRLRLPHLLDEFQGRHKGHRCFVVGNGPSLNQIDMTRLKNEITFGSNQCYLGYARWGFPFTYWGIYDAFQIQEYAHDYEASVPADGVQFFPFEYWPLLRFANACPVNVTWCREAAHQFSDLPERVYVGHTVTHMLLQIAATMGCDPIILIGMDHRYDVKPPSFLRTQIRRLHRFATRRTRDTLAYKMAEAAGHEWIKAHPHAPAGGKGFWDVKDTAQPTHFDARYTGQGRRRFRLPEPEEAERDFECASHWARQHGIRILNASPNSALNVFPKVSYEELF